MAVNKVEINGVVKLDLTADTVTAAKLARGETAHDASGELIIGTMIAPQLQIAVTTSAGATVTATKGSKTVSGTADASGNCTLVVDEPGIWTVTSVLGTMTASADVQIGTADITLAHVKSIFSENDWADIIAACRSGSVPASWAVGDSKTMLINNKSFQIDIIGKNHDDYADGSGKAPLTLQLHSLWSSTAAIHSARTNTVGWKDCTMRTKYLPSLLTKMPAEVQSGIREVSKKTSAGNTLTSIVVTADKLFLLSEIEVLGSINRSVQGEGQKYEYYTTAARRQKKILGESSNYYWWLRSPAANNNTEYCDIDRSGYSSTSSGSTLGVSFAFCF